MYRVNLFQKNELLHIGEVVFDEQNKKNRFLQSGKAVYQETNKVSSSPVRLFFFSCCSNDVPS